ncbi:MAG TPA: hypothetical protein DG942_08010 [Ruminococcaceae bacterium]|jgi:hypothetical protein|nr:hypothetical protein [Oscillospiraceae bacterium]
MRLHTRPLAKRLKPVVTKPGKNGKIALDPARVSALRRQAVIHLKTIFGEKETGAFAIQCIKTACDADRRAFRVEKKKISCSTMLAKFTSQKGF